MLYGLLPLLSGWIWVHKEDSGVLQLGQEKLVDKVEAPGFVLGAAAVLKGSLDAKYVDVHIELDGPSRAYPIDITAYDMYVIGNTRPLNFYGYLTVYDDTNKTYAGIVAPSEPIPFNTKFEVSLIPPNQPVEETTTLPINYEVVYDLVKITDPAAFKASLAALLSPITTLPLPPSPPTQPTQPTQPTPSPSTTRRQS